MSGDLEGDQGGSSLWLSDGKRGGVVAATGRGGGKGCSMVGGGAPYIATGGGWQMVARVATRGGRVAVNLGVVE
jgi:hypothetical protein